MPEGVERHATHLPLALDTKESWVQGLVSLGMAGFLMIMGPISFPVPWTPVPFSMMPFALLVAGGFQRPLWAALSVLVYLAAGAVGLPVYAEGSSGVQQLMGVTGGYLLGYAAMAVLMSWYMQERRRLLPVKWAAIIGAGVLATVVAGIVAIARLTGTGAGFEDYGEKYAGWALDTSILWVLAFLVVAVSGATSWALLRAKGQGHQVLNLFLVGLGAMGVLHVMGVTGLVLIAGLDVVTAIIVGSVVFLPFDIVKAGLAVGLLVPFLPDGADHA